MSPCLKLSGKARCTNSGRLKWRGAQVNGRDAKDGIPGRGNGLGKHPEVRNSDVGPGINSVWRLVESSGGACRSSLRPILKPACPGRVSEASESEEIFDAGQRGFPGGSDGKESVCNAGDLGSVLKLGNSLGEGNGYPLQSSCLENSMDRGAWQATVHGVTKSRTRLSD